MHCKQGEESRDVMLKGLLLMQFVFPCISYLLYFVFPLATNLNNFLPHSMFVLDVRLSVLFVVVAWAPTFLALMTRSSC